MIIKKIFIVLIIISSNVYSQWELVSSPTPNKITNIDFYNYIGFISTHNLNDSTGTLYRSINGGLTWVNQFTAQTPINNVYIRTLTEVIVAGNGHIWSSVDGGTTWTDKVVPNYELYDITFQNANTAYTCGFNRFRSEGCLIRSSNSGANWNFFFEDMTPYRFYCIRFPTIDTGYVCGEHGVMFKVIEGLTTWEPRNTGITDDLNSIHFFDGKKGLAAGNNGKLLRTTNGGFSWLAVNTGFGNIDFKCISFYNPQLGFLSGSNGFIAKSIDSGLTWHQQHTNTGSTLNTISFVNKDTIFVAGNNGTILRTFNGGNPIGIISNGSNPKSFMLFQNFPNPFNPETQIKFDLPKSEHTKLTVYDALGSVIEVLINTQLNSGSYKFNWDAASYPSGVYFYKLNAGDFTETKKMVLIK